MIMTMKEIARVVLAVAMCMSFVADATTGGLRPEPTRKLYTPNVYQEVYFSEMLSGDDSVTVLKVGPFEFSASCKTVTYDYHRHYYSSSYSSSSSSTSMMGRGPSSSSSHYYPHSTSVGSSGSGSGSAPCSSSHPADGGSYDPCSSSMSKTYEAPPSGPSSGTLTDDSSMHGDDDMYSSHEYSYEHSYDYSYEHSYDYSYEHSYDYSYEHSYDYSYSYDYSHTESFAALELTYTASDDDFMYGSPACYGESRGRGDAYYPDEDLIVGSYDAGESRKQTVFAGRDGGYGDMSTLQTTSGYYVSINGDSTIGIHKSWAHVLPGGEAYFPEGIDCMVAGVITYVLPTD